MSLLLIHQFARFSIIFLRNFYVSYIFYSSNLKFLKSSQNIERYGSIPQILRKFQFDNKNTSYKEKTSFQTIKLKSIKTKKKTDLQRWHLSKNTRSNIIQFPLLT